MKISNKLMILLAILVTSGCASTFTSIETTADPDVYYVTEIHQRIFVPPASTLYKCTANNMSMDCGKVGD